MSLIATLFSIIFIFLVILFYKLIGNKSATEVIHDSKNSTPLNSHLFNSDDLEYLDKYSTEILSNLGALIQTISISNVGLVSSRFQLMNETDNENIIIPYQNISVLFYTNHDQNLENNFILKNYSSPKSGFTEFDILDLICEFYRNDNSNGEWNYEILELIEIFKSNEDSITIALITGT